MTGKSKCKILKDIRREVARQNDIDLVISECKYQGECSGTCPKCEAEVRYLEAELRKRQQAGRAVAVAGIAAAMMVTVTGCDFPFLGPTGGDPMPPESQYQEQVDGEILPPGGIVCPPTTEGPTAGVPYWPDETDPDTDPSEEYPDDVPDLMGDIVVDPDWGVLE